MVSNLLRGLAEIRDEWSPLFELFALSDLSWSGKPTISDDLPGTVKEGLAGRGTRGVSLRNARRLFLPQVASKYAALHMPESFGTPLGRTPPLIATCHDLIPLRFPREYLGPGPTAQLRRFKDERRYSRADRVVCISPKTASDLKELLGIGPPRASVAWLGIDLEAWRRRAELTEPLSRLGVVRERYVVYAGYSDYRKNVRGMFGALTHARKQGLDLELVWAGHLPPTRRREVDALVQEFGLEDAVKFVGFVSREDLIALFQGALAHLFLSRLEGFGLSVAEAMAARCPVVVARSSGVDDVAGDAAVIVDPDVPEEAGQALLRIAREPSFAEQLRSSGEARSHLYDYRRMARDYVGVYREVTGV